MIALLSTLVTCRADGRFLDQALAAHCPNSACKMQNGITLKKFNVTLVGQGFHRGLDITACFVDSNVAMVAILIDLPSAVYANTYELDNAALRNQGPKVKVFGSVDVESIQQFAQPTALAVYAKLENLSEPNPELQHSGIRVAHVLFPLHARYPYPATPPAGGAYSSAWKWLTSPQTSITIPTPLILAKTHGESDWMIVEHSSTIPISWPVPTGNVFHTDFVVLTTIGVVIGSALIIARSLFK